METNPRISGIGDIYGVLARASRRPRYAFLVLQLVAEVADGRGQAGPRILVDGRPPLLREWLCTQLLPLSEQSVRRAALRARVAASLGNRLTGDPGLDGARLGQAVEDQVQAVGRANVSRAISDLVRAGLMSRFYAGYATNHAHRGGGRHAVYVIKPLILQLLRKPIAQPRASAPLAKSQGELFVA